MAKETKKPGAVTQTATKPIAEYDWSQSSVQGFENVNQEDLGIPFLSIIQKGNPQVDRDHKDYATKKIEGAEVGDIINTIANVVIASAGEPLEFIPCTFQKLWMEWTPRNKGGGLVKTHQSSQILLDCQRNDFGQDVLPNGNLIVTTAYFYGIAIVDYERQTCVIGMSSTQLKKSKQWLNMMMALKLNRSDGTKYTPPMFSHSYMLSSTPEKNEKGSWRGWLIQMGNVVKDPVLIADAVTYAKRATTMQRQIAAPADEHDDKLS